MKRFAGLMGVVALACLLILGCQEKSAKQVSSYYWGEVYRYVPEQYQEHAWKIVEYDIHAHHDYSPPGLGAIYGSISNQGALAEMVEQGTLAGRVLLEREIGVKNILDLSTEELWVEALKRAGLEGTYRDKETCGKVGEWASKEGYEGLLVRSMAKEGSINLVIFKLD